MIAPELSAELHLSADDLGNISASFFATFALAQFWVGSALDRHGPRRTLPGLMVLGVAGALLFARAEGARDAMLAMALIGVGFSAALMGPLYVFARTETPERFAILSALIIGLSTFGNLLGGTPLALASQAFGWRGVFYGLSGLTLIAGLLILMLVKDPPRIEHHGKPGEGILAGIKDIIAIRALWPVWPLMTVGYGILITERGLWVGPYLSQVHALAPVARGNVIFMMAVAIALGALAYGPLENYFRARKPLVLAGNVVAGLALLALAVMTGPSLGLATVLLCIFGFAAMTYGTLMAHIRHFLPDRLIGRGMAVANFLCMAGAGLLQTLSGVYVELLKTAALSPEGLFASLHLTLAVILLSATALYAFSRDNTLRSELKIERVLDR